MRQRVRQVVIPDGTVSASYAPPVGSAPQWGDDSLATYATIEGRYGTEVINLHHVARVDVAAEPDLVTVENPRVAIWYKATSDATLPMQVALSDEPGATYLIATPHFNSGSVTTPAHTSEGMSAPAGWSIVELFELGTTIDTALSFWRTNGLYLEFGAGRIAPAEDPPGEVFYQWTVYEARIVIYTDALMTAPPCRIFPRRDGLGVGGGTRFPPSKSQQRSGRRFGYY